LSIFTWRYPHGSFFDILSRINRPMAPSELHNCASFRLIRVSVASGVWVFCWPGTGYPIYLSLGSFPCLSPRLYGLLLEGELLYILDSELFDRLHVPCPWTLAFKCCWPALLPRKRACFVFPAAEISRIYHESGCFTSAFPFTFSAPSRECPSLLLSRQGGSR